MLKKASFHWLLALTLFPVFGFSIRAEFVYTHICERNQCMFVCTSEPADSILLTSWDLDGDGRFGDDTGDTVYQYFGESGYYNVGLRITTKAGISDAIYQQVGVSGATAAFSVETSCQNLPVYFTNLSTAVADSISQHIWDFGDGSSLNFETNPIHVFPDVGPYFVKLKVQSSYGCLDSITSEVLLTEQPIVDVIFSGDTVFPRGDSVIVTIIGIYDRVLWSTNETTNSVVIYEAGNYFVQGFRNNCYGERYFTITVTQDFDFKIMTLFTPNNDGYNDRWEIINLKLVSPCSVDIFNRWGEKVFSSPDYQNTWDGVFNGKKLPNDTYYYFLQCQDHILRTGTVNILTGPEEQ